MTTKKKYNTCKDCTQCIEKSPLFEHLSKDELEVMNEGRFEVKYKSGETIYKQGTDITHVLSVTSGMVKIYVEGLDDRNIIMGILKPFEIFGGPGLYHDRKQHYTLKAIVDTEVCFINADNFIKIGRQNNQFLESQLKHTSTRIIKTVEKLVNLTQKQMPGRMADALLFLTNRVYETNPFDMSISRPELAELTGMSKDSASRVFKDFQEAGIIRVDGKTIEILNMDKLKVLSEIG